MQEVDQLAKMANQIAENFSFHEDAAERTADHIRRFWAPSMQDKLIESDRAGGVELSDAARAALSQL